MNFYYRFCVLLHLFFTTVLFNFCFLLTFYLKVNTYRMREDTVATLGTQKAHTLLKYAYLLTYVHLNSCLM